VRSVRHALSAAAVAAVALGGLTAWGGLGVAASPTVDTAIESTADPQPVAEARPIGAETRAAGNAVAPRTTRVRPPRPVPSTTTRPAPSTTTGPAPTSPPAAPSSVARQILTRVNAERATAGCKAVVLDARLTAAAAGHAQDMATNDYFSHTSRDGRTFVDRITAQGYPVPRSENIAAGQPTATAVLDAWMASAGHRANILDCSAVAMGAASAKGGTYGIYWVQDFGR
jgi:uncharacterized protein YkwD